MSLVYSPRCWNKLFNHLISLLKQSFERVYPKHKKNLKVRDIFDISVYNFQETGATAFAHFDEYVRLQRLEAFLHKFHQLIIHRTYYDYEDENDNSDDWEWYSDSEYDDEQSEEDEQSVSDEGQ